MVDPVVGDDLVEQPVHQCDVGPRARGQVHGGGLGHRRGPWVDADDLRRVRPGEPVEDPRPQDHLGLGHVVAVEGDDVGVVDVGVRTRLAVGGEGLLEGGRRRRRAQPGVAVDVAGADATVGDQAEGVVLLEEELARGVEADRRWGPARRAAAASGRRRRPSPRPTSVSTSSPSRRTSGRRNRSGEALACQPKRSLGPSRPWLTRSVPRPRTPTMRSSLTAMSSASPLECRIDAVGTHRSTSAAVSPSSRWVSTRTGHVLAAPVRRPRPPDLRIRSIRDMCTNSSRLVLQRAPPALRWPYASWTTQPSDFHAPTQGPPEGSCRPGEVLGPAGPRKVCGARRTPPGTPAASASAGLRGEQLLDLRGPGHAARDEDLLVHDEAGGGHDPVAGDGGGCRRRRSAGSPAAVRPCCHGCVTWKSHQSESECGAGQSQGQCPDPRRHHPETGARRALPATRRSSGPAPRPGPPGGSGRHR